MFADLQRVSLVNPVSRWKRELTRMKRGARRPARVPRIPVVSKPEFSTQVTFESLGLTIVQVFRLLRDLGAFFPMPMPTTLIPYPSILIRKPSFLPMTFALTFGTSTSPISLSVSLHHLLPPSTAQLMVMAVYPIDRLISLLTSSFTFWYPLVIHLIMWLPMYLHCLGIMSKGFLCSFLRFTLMPFSSFVCTDIVDIKPVNMEDLSEVITAAEFHPNSCSLFIYSSSKGILRLCDMRQQAICDKSTLSELYHPPFLQPKANGFAKIGVWIILFSKQPDLCGRYTVGWIFFLFPYVVHLLSLIIGYISGCNFKI